MKIPAPPTEADFTSRLRSPAVAARVGLWLGVCFGICFLTGLLSHYAQNPVQPIPFPTSPSWGYRVTQGLHVVTGTAAVPLLLVKLWTRLPAAVHRGRRRAARAAGGRRRWSGPRSACWSRPRSSSWRPGWRTRAQWYPWAFSLPRHPLRHGLGRDRRAGRAHRRQAARHPRTRSRGDVDDTDARPADRGRAGARCPAAACCARPGSPAAVAVLATAGSTVPLLRNVSVFGVRSGDGPRRHPDQQVRQGRRGDRDGDQRVVPPRPWSTATARSR